MNEYAGAGENSRLRGKMREGSQEFGAIVMSRSDGHIISFNQQLGLHFFTRRDNQSDQNGTFENERKKETPLFSEDELNVWIFWLQPKSNVYFWGSKRNILGKKLLIPLTKSGGNI